METLETTLKQYFGYTTFWPGQRQVIEQVLAGRDVFVLMPTGGGKSLTYQLPALLMPGLIIVVSPLIALMRDQVERLRANGIPATFLNSSLSGAEGERREYAVLNGQIKPLIAKIKGDILCSSVFCCLALLFCCCSVLSA